MYPGLQDPPLRKNKLPSKIQETKKDEESPASTSTYSLSSPNDNVVLMKLAADFDTFHMYFMRKQNLLTSMVTDLLSEVKSLKQTITEMSNCRKLDPSTLENIFEKLTLPARSVEEINEVESYLLPPEVFTKVVQEMSKVGGNSPFDFVKRVMLQLMTYKMATCYTWYGTKEKLAFKDTRMSHMILQASEGMGNKKQIEEALQKFFRRAKERIRVPGAITPR